MQKVEDVKTSLIIGEYYLVPCFIRTDKRGRTIYPVINHPHSDKENGQDEIHYHLDNRFYNPSITRGNGGVSGGKVYEHEIFEGYKEYKIIGHPFERFSYTMEQALKKDYIFEYYSLPCITSEQYGTAGIIKFSKLKHKCIHKGKCPHRGYSLDQVEAKDGIITCPLHGLRFKEDTKELINEI